MTKENLLKFIPCSEQEPPHGQEVLTWSQEAEDKNEFDGVIVGFKSDEEYWQFAVWCISCDEWHTRYTENCKEILGDDWSFKYWPTPTHWKFKY